MQGLICFFHLVNRSAFDRAAIDYVKIQMCSEKIIDFYQNFQAKNDSHTLSGFAIIDLGPIPFLMSFAKGTPTNTYQQERAAG